MMITISVNSPKKTQMVHLVLLLFILCELVHGSHLSNVLVINLKRRSDKRKLAIRQFELLGVENYSFIDGFDGAAFFQQVNATISALKRETRLDGLRFSETAIRSRPGASVGCLIGHMQALNYIISKNITGPILVLEDDFLADGNAFTKLEGDISKLPTDWNIYYPGHCAPSGTCRNFIDPEKTICIAKGEVYCAHSYVVNGAKTAKLLFDYSNSEKPQLADLIYQSHPVNRYVRFPSLFAQYRVYFKQEADVKSSGGIWTKLHNDTIAQKIKP